MDCERCGLRAGSAYSFHYGRRLASQVIGSTGTSDVVRTTFRMSGQASVSLCDTCVEGNRRRRALRFGVWFGVLLLISIAIWGTSRSGTISGARALLIFVAIGTSIGAIATFALMMAEVRQDRRSSGESFAIAIRGPSLAAAGDDVFFDSAAYARLNHSSGGP